MFAFGNGCDRSSYAEVKIGRRVRWNKAIFNGNLIETKAPDGTVTRTSYDGFGRQQYVQDRAILDGSDATTAPATFSVYDASGRDLNAPEMIWDLKTGNAKLTEARISQIRDHLPEGFKDIPIAQIRL